MPNIKPIDAGVIAFRPSDMGPEAAAATGRRIGAFYNQAGQAQQTTGIRLGGALREAGDVVQQHIANNEIARGGLAFAQAAAEADDNWNKQYKTALADPTDASVAGMDQRFNEQHLEPALEKFRSGFVTQAGQNWADHQINQFREHMYHKTAADMSSLAGDQVKASAAGTVNTWTSNVYADPSQLGIAITAIDHYINGGKGEDGKVVPGLVPTSRMNDKDAADVSIRFTQEAKKKLVNAAIQGLIRDGKPYDGVVKDNAQYVTQAEADKYANEERSQKRANRINQAAIDREEQHKIDEAASSKVTEIMGKGVYADEATSALHVRPGVVKDLTQLLNSPGISRAARNDIEHQINLAQGILSEKRNKNAFDPEALQDAHDGLYRTENPTTAATLAELHYAGKINDRQYSDLTKLLKATQGQDMKSPLFRSAMAAVNEKLGVGSVFDGHERRANFDQQFIPAYTALPADKRAEALNLADPNSLVRKLLEGHAPSPTEILYSKLVRQGMPPNLAADIAKTMTPPAAAAPTARPAAGPAAGPTAIERETGVKPTTIRAGGQTMEVPQAAPQPVSDEPLKPHAVRTIPAPRFQRPPLSDSPQPAAAPAAGPPVPDERARGFLRSNPLYRDDYDRKYGTKDDPHPSNIILGRPKSERKPAPQPMSGDRT